MRDLSPTIDAVHAAGGLAAVATDLLACTVLTPPEKAMGLDASEMVEAAAKFEQVMNPAAAR